MESISQSLKKEYLAKLYDAWRSMRIELHKVEEEIKAAGGVIPLEVPVEIQEEKESAMDIVLRVCKSLYKAKGEWTSKMVDFEMVLLEPVPVHSKTISNTLARLADKGVLKIKTKGEAGIRPTVYTKPDDVEW